MVKFVFCGRVSTGTRKTPESSLAWQLSRSRALMIDQLAVICVAAVPRSAGEYDEYVLLLGGSKFNLSAVGVRVAAAGLGWRRTGILCGLPC